MTRMIRAVKYRLSGDHDVPESTTCHLDTVLHDGRALFFGGYNYRRCIRVMFRMGTLEEVVCGAD
jgi:hypothetical protein